MRLSIAIAFVFIAANAIWAQDVGAAVEKEQYVILVRDGWVMCNRYWELAQKIAANPDRVAAKKAADQACQAIDNTVNRVNDCVEVPLTRYQQFSIDFRDLVTRIPTILADAGSQSPKTSYGMAEFWDKVPAIMARVAAEGRAVGLIAYETSVSATLSAFEPDVVRSRWIALQSDLQTMQNLYSAGGGKVEASKFVVRWTGIARQYPVAKDDEEYDFTSIFADLIHAALGCFKAIAAGQPVPASKLNAIQSEFCQSWSPSDKPLPPPNRSNWFSSVVTTTSVVQPSVVPQCYEAEVVAEWNWLQSALLEMHNNMTGQPPDITWLKERCDEIVLRTSSDALKWQEKPCPADLKMFHEWFYAMISFSGTALQEIEAAYEKSDHSRFLDYASALSEQQRRMLEKWPKSFAPPKVLRERWFAK